MHDVFQFTHPGRGATFFRRPKNHFSRFQFTHPGRGATVIVQDLSKGQPVSIHAPREGCDITDRSNSFACTVSIHAPREGCDESGYLTHVGRYTFQFTHPGRGATAGKVEIEPSILGFNSRTPGGVRLTCTDMLTATLRFQFTHPGRGATPWLFRTKICKCSFNSRTPGGVRLNNPLSEGSVFKFQFTHPGRGATERGQAFHQGYRVSIHAPREGCDRYRRPASSLV